MYDIELRLSGEKPRKSYQALVILQNFSMVVSRRCQMFHMSSTKNLVDVIVELHSTYEGGDSTLLLGKQ